MNPSELLVAKGLQKEFEVGKKKVPVLKGIDLTVKKGEALCIMGASGAGKSTLLQILGTLDRPSRGDVFFEGKSLFSLSDDELSVFRNQKLGFVFQFHHLLPEFTALENVMLPCQIAGESDGTALMKAQEILARLGMDHRVKHYPNELSGGEQQRVAIARALVMKPALLLADEPTGNLDSENAKLIQKILFDMREQFNLTTIVVSHDLEFAQKFPRILSLKDGRWERD